MQDRRLVVAMMVGLMLVVMWPALYQFVGTVTPGGFFGSVSAGTITNYLFFSFMTLTTVGYGNLIPATPIGQSLSMLEAILGHASYSGVPRVTRMAKTLFAVDELTGLVTATALVRPSRSVHEVDARSVRKKMKDKAFARGVNRDDVVNGAADLGVDLDWHIQFVIDAMRARAESLGLAGSPSGG